MPSVRLATEMCVAARPIRVYGSSLGGLQDYAVDECVRRALGNKSNGFVRRPTEEAQQIGQVTITQGCQLQSTDHRCPVLVSASVIRRTLAPEWRPLFSVVVDVCRQQKQPDATPRSESSKSEPMWKNGTE